MNPLVLLVGVAAPASWAAAGSHDVGEAGFFLSPTAPLLPLLEGACHASGGHNADGEAVLFRVGMGGDS